MNQLITANVRSITRYSVDGMQGCTLYVEQEAENPEVLGNDIMKISAPYALWEAAKASGFTGPCDCQLELQMRRGGQMKAGLFCVSLHPVKPTKTPTTPATANGQPPAAGAPKAS